MDKVSKSVSNARARVSSSKCIKWAQECTNKSKNTAISVAERVRSFPREASANLVTEKRSSRRPKPSKFLSRKVCPTITQSPFQVKVTKFQTPWLET